MGCERRPRVPVCSRNGGRGIIWHYSRVYDVDYGGPDKAGAY
jgi:hypothetical protein